MSGYVIFGLVAALMHKAKAQGTAASGTHVTVGNPTFDVVSPKHIMPDIIISREPGASTLDAWQNGPMQAVPAGSRPDIFSTQNSHSDSKLNQIIGLQQYQGEGPRIINPNERGPGSVPTSGFSASTPGAGAGGVGAPIGGGGFSGHGGLK
jgi:hypothetical protein